MKGLREKLQSKLAGLKDENERLTQELKQQQLSVKEAEAKYNFVKKELDNSGTFSIQSLLCLDTLRAASTQPCEHR